MVQQLGGTVVENPKYCTHLVAQSFSRTMKFFVAINVCHHVVSKQWVEDSFQQNQFIGKCTLITSKLIIRSKGYKTKSCSTQLSMKFFLLISVKLPTIVGILTFMSRKNSILSLSEPKKSRISLYFYT